MTDMKNEVRKAYAVNFIAGFAVCFAVSIISGRKEAWDSPLYFSVGIPLMMAVSFYISSVHSQKVWRWAIAMAFGQSIAMCLSGHSLSLWPLSMIAMTVCSI